jgi:hypothetical protein
VYLSRPSADFFLDGRAETHLGNRQTEGEEMISRANGRRKIVQNPLKIHKKHDSQNYFLAMLLLA